MLSLQISRQLTFCAWLYPKWRRWYPRLGVFELKTSETPSYIENHITCDLREDGKGSWTVRADDVHNFKVNDSIDFNNILRLMYLLKDYFLMFPLESGTDSAYLMTLKRMKVRWLSVDK